MNEQITISALSDLTGLDRRRLKRDLGDLRPVEGNGYDVSAALKRLFAAADARRSDTPEIQSERLRLLRAKAELADIELVRAQKSMIDTETVARVWENLAAGIKRVVVLSPLPEADKKKICNELATVTRESYVEAAQ